MEKRKILYIGNNLRGKGTNITTIETLSEQLRELGYMVVTASSKKNKFIRLMDMMLAVVKYRRRVSRVIIDTYSTQNFYYAVAVANLCRLFRIPYIPILHGGNLPQRLEQSRSQSYKLFGGALTNVAPSQYLKQAFEKHGYSNLTYIPNTIEISEYNYLKRVEIRPKLLWVRSFAEIYNPMLAIALIEKMMDAYPKAALCMVGPDKDGSLEVCREHAKSKNLPVQFTGKLDKKAWRELSKDYYVFINTTHFDNTPVSVIEAMALGLPIVSTNVGGMPYLIENKKEGILVPPNDVESLFEAVQSLLKNPTTAFEMSENAREKVGNFDWNIVKLEWEELLKE